MIPRLRLLLAVLLTCLVVFTGRLMYLQLAMAEQYTALSAQNFLEERRISPLRGRILARDGTVLADSRIAYDLMFTGGEIEHWQRLKFLLGLEAKEPRQPDMSKQEERLEGAVLAWNIPDRLVPGVEELVAGQPNLYLRERIERSYPTNLAAHLVGYTTLADPVRFPGYASGELVGVMGIEAGLEKRLFGAAGSELVEVNNRGVVLRETELVPAQPGDDVVLTIDTELQRLAEDVLLGSIQYINAERAKNDLPLVETVRGALLAADPDTGEVLAMASTPSFDQNIFTHRPTDPEEVSRVLNDATNHPLLNRAVEAYHPASTFKIVTSSTLLEDGYIDRYDRYACSASMRYGGFIWENWAPGFRGNYDVTEAIADSCNTYFWYAAMDTPDFSSGWGPFISDLVDRAREFGFGREVGVPLPEEETGLIPDEEWVLETEGHAWYPGYTLNSVIGQGNVRATPLQTLQFVITLANSGRMVVPQVVKSIDGVEKEPEVYTVPGEHWDVLREGMREMITDHGSSWFLGPAVDFPITVAGKTGTAQNGHGVGLEHVWFMGYAPVEEPEIAIVVFLEYGGSSSAVAVPVARDFLLGYLALEGE
ncbi:MAG TPA: penicillin-binding transpeptidase domain-containing protein [Trueperaceae bacterium]